MNSNIVAKQVYEWIKTGHWSLAQFNEWLTDQEKAIHNIGYAAGLTWKERTKQKLRDGQTRAQSQSES